jgi:hypothetical protein
MQSLHHRTVRIRLARFMKANAEAWTADWTPERWQREYVAAATLRAEQRAARRAACPVSSNVARGLLDGLQAAS